MRRGAGTRGFTLIEMMVALVVGAIGVVVAAKVAQVVIRQSAEGQQNTDFNARSRLLARQLRADIRAAGYGSTGAIAVDAGLPPWNTPGFTILVNGKAAMPAVRGANNLTATSINGTPVQVGSDALMIAVPNPGLSGVTTNFTPNGTNTITLGPPPTNPTPPVQPLSQCTSGLVYAVDHTAPNGAGRAQLLVLVGVVGDTVTTAGNLQFTLAPGSSVSCARLSTYWVDANGWLHRTDFGAGAAPFLLGGQVWVDAASVGANDLIAPGVLDLQIAYRFSSEIYTNAALALPAPNDFEAQWAHEGRLRNVDLMLLANPQNWFEVRRIRVNTLVRTQRQVDPRAVTQKNLLAREDGVVTAVNRSVRVEWVTTAETLTNLRYFDYGAPQGVVSEPF